MDNSENLEEEVNNPRGLSRPWTVYAIGRAADVLSTAIGIGVFYDGDVSKEIIPTSRFFMETFGLYGGLAVTEAMAIPLVVGLHKANTFLTEKGLYYSWKNIVPYFAGIGSGLVALNNVAGTIIDV